MSSTIATVSSQYQHQASAFSPDALSSYSLRMILHSGGMAYVLLSASGKIVSIKDYKSSSHDPGLTLKAAIETDPFLISSFREIKLFSSQSDFTLVPSAYWNPGDDQKFASILLGENPQDLTLGSDEIFGLSGRAIFTLPGSLKKAVSSLKVQSHQSCVAIPVIQEALKLSQTHPSFLLLSFFDDRMICTAIRNKQLHFCNSFTVQTPEDAVYFAELSARASGISGTPFSVFLSGFIEPGDVWETFIRQQIPAVAFPIHEWLGSFETQSEKLPVWKYGYLAS